MKVNVVPSETHRFPLRAEAAILLGMLLVVGSLFLTWQRVTSPGTALFAGAVYHDHAAPMAVANGFGAGVWQPLALCALLAGSTLLWKPAPAARPALLVVQGACALACLVIALTHFALLPGVLVGLVGATLLMFGALVGYSVFAARDGVAADAS